MKGLTMDLPYPFRHEEVPLKNVTNTLGRMLGERVYNCVVYRQGTRWFVEMVVSFDRTSATFAANPLKRKSAGLDEIDQAINREFNPGQRNKIADYIKMGFDADEPINVPPLLVNVYNPDQVTVYTIPELSIGPNCLAGFVKIQPGTELFIKDGQHREGGLKKVYGELLGEAQLAFSCSSIAVMLSFEKNSDVCKMDFVACAKARPVSASLLTAWDQQDTARRLATQVAREATLLQGRIDANSTTISPKAEFLYTLKDVKTFTNTFVVGSSAVSPNVADLAVARALKEPDEFPKMVDRICDYLNELCEHIDILARIRQSSGSYDLPTLRNEGWMPMSVPGFTVLGQLGHHLTKRSDWPEVARGLRTIDWRRPDGTGAGQLWLKTGLYVERIGNDGQRRIETTRSRDAGLATISAIMNHLLPQPKAAA